MDRNSLISIIVPVYNVEKYIRRCVDSILEQTYTRLEIILVDDGSTDKSGIICDEYMQKDARIVVIHKSNGGLSSARNAGLDIAGGEYIGFVDSDDYIEPDMFFELYMRCVHENLDLAAARFVENVDGKDALMSLSGDFRIFDGKKMLEINILGNEKYIVTNSVWDRLYTKKLIGKSRFPEGRKYEDICFSTYIFLKAKRCGYLDKVLYHYTVRSDSIMGMGIKNKHEISDDLFDDLIPQLRDQTKILYRHEQNLLAESVRYAIFNELKAKFFQIGDIKTQKNAKKRIIREIKKDRKWYCKYIVDHGKMKEIAMTFCLCYFSPVWFFYLKIKKGGGHYNIFDFERSDW